MSRRDGFSHKRDMLRRYNAMKSLIKTTWQVIFRSSLILQKSLFLISIESSTNLLRKVYFVKPNLYSTIFLRTRVHRSKVWFQVNFLYWNKSKNEKIQSLNFYNSILTYFKKKKVAEFIQVAGAELAEPRGDLFFKYSPPQVKKFYIVRA